jgi:flagellar hook-associated protein 2
MSGPGQTAGLAAVFAAGLLRRRYERGPVRRTPFFLFQTSAGLFDGESEMVFSFNGLASGLDTQTIIDGLLSIRNQQIARLQGRKQEIQLRQTAFQGIESNVLALKSAVRQLNSVTNNVFSVFSATSSNESVLEVAAGSSAVAGTYQLTVSQLARAEQVSSQSLSGEGSLLTTGKIAVQVGNRTAIEVNIDSSNNTLSGLADSINAAGDDIKAAVINDGGGYRLLLSSQYTGAANTISITNNTAASNATETRIDFSGPAVQQATDAVLVIGSGAGAVNISRPTNLIDDVIGGLSLKLQKAEPGTPVTISVSRDIEPSRKAVEGFVAAFNKTMDFIDQQTAFDPETSRAGLLLGNSATNSIRDQLRGQLASSIAFLDQDANRLSAAGITFTDNGRLQVNSSTLDRALAGNLPGVSVDDVRRMFALGATSTSPGISFVSGSSATTSSSTPWQVVVTRASERAAITGTNDLAASTVIDGTSDEFQIDIDGSTSIGVRLAHGTYTREQLAAQVQSAVNQAASLNNGAVTVSLQGNRLSVQSNAWGTQSVVGNIKGETAAILGFSGTELDRGIDVAGYFRVGGQTETATGNGRLLSGDAENKNTSGLILSVKLTPAQVGASHQSDLTVTRGFAARLEQEIDRLLDPETGRFGIASKSFDSQIKSVEASSERLNKVIEAQQQKLARQFAAIETGISRLQAASSLLGSQLTSFNQLRTG